MTLHGKKKETEKDVNTMHKQLQILFANPLAVIGRIMGSNCTENDGKLIGVRSFNNSCLQCLWDTKITKQRRSFNGSNEIRTVISANQLSVQGAVEDLCTDLSEGVRASGKPAAPLRLEKMEIPTDLLPMHSSGETLSKNTIENSNTWSKTRNYPNYALMRVWSLSKEDNTSILQGKNATFMPRTHDASKREGDSCSRMASQKYGNRPSLGQSLPSWRLILFWSSCQISVSRQNRFLG